MPRLERVTIGSVVLWLGARALSHHHSADPQGAAAALVCALVCVGLWGLSPSRRWRLARRLWR